MFKINLLFIFTYDDDQSPGYQSVAVIKRPVIKRPRSGVRSLLCMKWSNVYFLCTFVTLQESGVHPLLTASTHFLWRPLTPCLGLHLWYRVHLLQSSCTVLTVFFALATLLGGTLSPCFKLIGRRSHASFLLWWGVGIPVQLPRPCKFALAYLIISLGDICNLYFTLYCIAFQVIFVSCIWALFRPFFDLSEGFVVFYFQAEHKLSDEEVAGKNTLPQHINTYDQLL